MLGRAAAVAVLAGSCALPASAGAGTLTFQHTINANGTSAVLELRFDAAPGERNDLRVRQPQPGVVNVQERSGAPLKFEPRALHPGVCVIHQKQARCTGGTGTPTIQGDVDADTITHFSATLGDGDDRLDATGLSPSGLSKGLTTVDAWAGGGEGDDSFVSDAVGSFNGGSGNDLFDGRYGDFVGGDGDDRSISVLGDITMEGGPGADAAAAGPTYTWIYSGRPAGVRVTPDGVADDGEAGEGDNVPATTVRLIAGAGPDELWGAPVGTSLEGNGGDDVIHGGPAPDDVSPGTGADSVLVAGGGADRVFCRGPLAVLELDLLDTTFGC